MGVSENPLISLFQAFQNISNCIQTQISSLTGIAINPSPPTPKEKQQPSLLSFSSSSSDLSTQQCYDVCFKGSIKSNLFVITTMDKVAYILTTKPHLFGSCYDIGGKVSSPVTKEELGSATWTFLHTLAAQYPEHPTRQQKKDVKELMAILSRMYPCKECADHFKEVLRSNPVQAGSQTEFSQWLCHVHNVVNRSLGKPVFLCERVDARWGKLDCEQRLCDLHGSTNFGHGIL